MDDFKKRVVFDKASGMICGARGQIAALIPLNRKKMRGRAGQSPFGHV
ncbi:hypothetical protein [Agrobacterium fabrum]